MTMETVRDIEPGKSMLALAAWVDEVRMVDNIVL
jgi:pantoate--beta-alanine ligase